MPISRQELLPGSQLRPRRQVSTPLLYAVDLERWLLERFTSYRSLCSTNLQDERDEGAVAKDIREAQGQTSKSSEDAPAVVVGYSD
jgi:hypothetical protein